MTVLFVTKHVNRTVALPNLTTFVVLTDPNGTERARVPAIPRAYTVPSRWWEPDGKDLTRSPLPPSPHRLPPLHLSRW